MVKAAGITNSSTQLLINAINPIFSLIAAIYGATLLDKLGRRTMLMAGLVGALGAYIMLTAFTASAASASSGISRLHGPHHEPHALMTTIRTR